MKRLKISVAVLFIFALSCLMLSSGVFAEPTSYPMVCKGGGNMSLSCHTMTGFTINFSKSPYAASQQQPGPGQCAWVDRSISANEPSKISSLHPCPTYLEKVRYSNNRFTVEGVKGDLAYCLNAIENNQLFYVHIKNYQGNFHIIRTGP